MAKREISTNDFKDYMFRQELAHETGHKTLTGIFSINEAPSFLVKDEKDLYEFGCRTFEDAILLYNEL